MENQNSPARLVSGSPLTRPTPIAEPTAVIPLPQPPHPCPFLGTEVTPTGAYALTLVAVAIGSAVLTAITTAKLKCVTLSLKGEF